MKKSITIILFLTALMTQAQVGIGVATENIEPSAQLEVKSTLKGFLPPRMTNDEKVAIATPVAGLVVWCTNCGAKGELQVYNGSKWTNMVGGIATIVPTKAVGDSYGGGIVAYILQPGDDRYVPNVTHGLIAATSDQSSAAAWGCMSNITGIASTNIGSGNGNTAALIDTCSGTPVIAAQIAQSYDGGGFSDWYLPSKDELNTLYLNKELIGGFSDGFYWSSSEGTSPYDDNYSWGQFFNNGIQQYYDNVFGVKAGLQNVRAVRSF